MATERRPIQLPMPVYDALTEAKPPGMTYYGYLIQALDLEVDPADL